MNHFNIIVSPDIDQNKITSDIKFIEKLINYFKQYNWRVVVYGGYGLDAYLKTTTRNHGDIDLVIYGRSPRKFALSSIVDYLKKNINEVVVKSKEEDFLIDIKLKSKILGGNLYYVQTADDPLTNLSIVIKADGSFATNTLKDFPPPVTGRLGDLVVEVQDQKSHLEDILRKRKSDKSLPKHDQDIQNIKSAII